MSAFAVVEENTEKEIRLRLTGPIDEDADFSKIPPIQTEKLVVNMEQVTILNSCGTREWAKWVQTIQNDTHVTLEKCPRAFIDQANLFDGLFPKQAMVSSFYIPYFCMSCKNSSDTLLTWGKEVSSSHVEYPEFIKCGNCGEEAEADIIENVYFRFLKKVHPEL